jgi:hypothetical protein
LNGFVRPRKGRHCRHLLRMYCANVREAGRIRR